MKIFEPISDSQIDLIYISLINNPVDWIYDKDIVFNKNRIYIGNWHEPESMTLKIGNLSYSVPAKTISIDQANKICAILIERGTDRQLKYVNHYLEKL